MAVAKLEIVRQTVFYHFNGYRWWQIEIKVAQEVSNLLTCKFQWYTFEELCHIKRYHAFVGRYVGKLDALKKLSRIEHAVL